MSVLKLPIVFKTHTVAGRRIQMPLALFDHHHSTGKPLFYHFKLNVTDEKSVKSIRERNSQLPASVPFSKTSVLKLADNKLNTRLLTPLMLNLHDIIVFLRDNCFIHGFSSKLRNSDYAHPASSVLP